MRRLVVLALLVTGTAHADDDDATDRPSVVRVRLDGQTAQFTARYAFDVAGPDFGLPGGTIALPSRGVVVGAIVTVGGVAHRLALDPADHTAKVFDDLSTAAGGPHREWAAKVTQEVSGGSVTVDVAAPHAAHLFVELEMTAPTCFFEDARYVAVPEPWRFALPPELVRHLTGDKIPPCGDAAEGEWLKVPTAEVSSRPFGAERIGTHAGRLDLAAEHIARVEVALAKTISQVPPDLATVFVVDASRSVTGGQLQAQQAIVESYVRHAPRSRVQIIAYARKARALLPSWSIASQAATRITRELAQLPGDNGSNIDAGIAEAAAWLSRIEGTHRIVVFSDERLPDRLIELDSATLKSTLPDGTLVHAVALDATKGSIERDDNITFGALAKATEGIGVFGRVDGEDQADALQLVRPIAFEQVKVRALGWTSIQPDSGHACADENGTLAEGSSCMWWGHGIAAVGPIELDGLLWNHRVERVLRPDPAQGRAVARELSVIASGLGEALELEIKRAAFAVNDVWSLLGTWGGSDGYGDVDKIGLGGWGRGCACGGSGDIGIGVGSFGTLGRKLDLKAQLERGIARCKPGNAHIEIDLEMTVNEIVDVHVTADPALHDCIVEAVWDTSVVIPDAQNHSYAHTVFGG
jgi:hypothetical protein